MDHVLVLRHEKRQVSREFVKETTRDDEFIQARKLCELDEQGGVEAIIADIVTHDDVQVRAILGNSSPGNSSPGTRLAMRTARWTKR